MTERNARDGAPHGGRRTDEGSTDRTASRGEALSKAVDGIGRPVRTHPVLAFVLVGFAYSWGVFALSYAIVGGEALSASRWGHVPFAWGPPIAAVSVLWLRGGSVRAWLGAVLDPRANSVWYLLAGGVAFLFADTGSVLVGLAGVDLQFEQPPSDVAVSFLATLFLAGALEEIGWRGFAQPCLQERYDALVGATLVGLAWGSWHAPWLLLGGAGYGDGSLGALVGLTLFSVLASVLFAWLFNGSGGTLPVVMLAHAVVNTGTVLEPAGALPGWLPETQLGLVLWIVIAVAVLVRYGRPYLAKRGPDPAVPWEA